MKFGVVFDVVSELFRFDVCKLLGLIGFLALSSLLRLLLIFYPCLPNFLLSSLRWTFSPILFNEFASVEVFVLALEAIRVLSLTRLLRIIFILGKIRCLDVFECQGIRILLWHWLRILMVIDIICQHRRNISLLLII